MEASQLEVKHKNDDFDKRTPVIAAPAKYYVTVNLFYGFINVSGIFINFLCN